ncbi:MAG TPA: T9SS type A sorting domain-containing protein [Ignavibacteria bacterium]|nr:T9SS type A sorting domain-containing protein [Ignavibacteria bacterium]
MKFILIPLFLFISGLNLFGQNYWQISDSPTGLNLRNVFFINNNTGWISGDSGFIARTDNGGENWTVQPTNLSEQIQDFFFVNDRLGWALAWEVSPDSSEYYGTKILKTTNGGINWTVTMYSEPNIFMNAVYFIDSVKGFLAGSPLTIVYTLNSGERWFPADTDTSLAAGFPVVNLKFTDSLNGYACGGFRDIAGSMWRTSNGGFNWKGTIVGPEPLNDIFIFSPQKAIAAGGDFEYGSSTVRTSNGGLNWLYDTLGTFGVASAIDFRTPYNGWIALGIAQKFAFSNDSGNTWQTAFTPDSVPVFGIFFADSIHGWAVGYDGMVLKYNPAMIGVSPSILNSIPDKIKLYQNYPNPFNPVTKLEFGIPDWGFVSLKIYDAIGAEVETLVNENLSRGSYIVNWNASDFPSGVYYYILKSGNITETRKMILLK